MNTFKPTDSYPDLTDEHLVAIARLLRDTRTETIRLYDPAAGDGRWSLGCRIYERSINRIREAATRLGWLTIVQESSYLRLTFAIGAIALRFYSGSSDDPPPNYSFTTFGELRQQRLALDMGSAPALDSVLRLAVEPGVRGEEEVVVTLVELDLVGRVTNTYVVPLEATCDNVLPMITPPVELPPPTVYLRETNEQSEKRAKDAGEMQG